MKIKEVSVTEFQSFSASSENFTLLDVREHHEVVQGMIAGALHIPLGQLEARAKGEILDQQKPVYAYCASGIRSIRAAEILQVLGYSAASVAGGYKAYLKLKSESNVCSSTRYCRQISLPEVGDKGQAKIESAHVALIGVGGIGSIAGLYLAAAGVKELTLIDSDLIEESNLHRQISYSNDEIGLKKVEQAAKRFTAINTGLKVNISDQRLTVNNALSVLNTADIILDGSDNFETRYLANDTSLQLSKPLVHASVHQFSGLVGIFNTLDYGSLRDLFPEQPPNDLIPNCAEAGVLGPVVGVIGSLACTAVLKLILGLYKNSDPNLFMVELDNFSVRQLKILARESKGI